MNIENLIKTNKEYEFELQKLIDISSNIKDKDLSIRIIAQTIKCQEKAIEIVEKRNKNKL